MFVAAGIAGEIIASAVGLWGDPVAGATGALILGAALAWELLDSPSYYPDGFGARSYQETYLPVIATYVGGLAGLLVCAYRSFIIMRRPKQPLQTDRSSRGC